MAIIFLIIAHSNVNDSDLRRWAMAIAFNKKLNNPVKEHHCPQYYPLYMLPNSAIMDCDNSSSTEEKGYNCKYTINCNKTILLAIKYLEVKRFNHSYRTKIHFKGK